MTQTPLQEAIEIATGELYQTEGNLHQRSYNEGIRDVLKRLESLLPKEREFVRKTFEAGVNYMFEETGPNLQDYLNQLYPKS